MGAKSWFAVGLFVVLGVALGATAAFLPAGLGTTSGESKIVAPDLPPADGPQPVVKVDDPDFDFGIMERNASGSHTFTFSNVGDYPLVLKAGETTCKCTLSQVTDEKVAPGKATDVTLTWEAKTEESRFRQTATILTNDPRRQRVELTVSGRVGRSIEVQPPELVFSSVTPEETPTGELVVYSFTQEDFAIKGHELLKEDIAKFFDISVEAIDKSELAPEALSGQRVKVALKPGLPFGRMEQVLRLNTNMAGVPSPEVIILGSVSNGVSVLGGDWDPNSEMIKLGAVPKRSGATRTLKLLVRGPRRHEVRFEPLACTPEFIEVSVGEAVDVGNAVQVPVTFTIPPDSPNVAYFGSKQGGYGEIRLNSNNDEIGEVRLRMRFAIEG